MIARVLPVLLLLAAAPAPESDPFLAALAGKSGSEAVAAPSFDPDLAAFSWTTRPRREIVDALAARLLRGEAKGWFDRGKDAHALSPLPSRYPADFVPGRVEVSDRLAARIPADAAAVFFASVEEAEKCVGELAKFLPCALPVPFADAPGGRRDALARAVDGLLVPTIWRSNPAVRRGTRQAALLASDPDLRGAPEVALVVEVDDASLVRFHRQSSLSWEDRGRRRLRVDGLDAVADDGSVRSFFGLEGGIAVWSTGKTFRDRILAAAAGRAPTLLSPDPRAYALARATFPAAEGGALLVIPDGFLERASSPAIRARRAAALRCDAVRMVLEARALSKVQSPPGEGVRLSCPSGGEIRVPAGRPGASCSVHGTALYRVPLGDLPDAAPVPGRSDGDSIATGAFPVAASWSNGAIEVLVSPGRPGAALMEIVRPPSSWSGGPEQDESVLRRLDRIRASGISEAEAASVYASIFGEAPESNAGRRLVWEGGGARWEGGWRIECLELSGDPLSPKPKGGVLRIGIPHPGSIELCGAFSFTGMVLPLEWR